MKRNIQREIKYQNLLSKQLIGPPKRNIEFYAVVQGELNDSEHSYVVGDAYSREEAQANAEEFIALNNIRNATVKAIYPFRS